MADTGSETAVMDFVTFEAQVSRDAAGEGAAPPADEPVTELAKEDAENENEDAGDAAPADEEDALDGGDETLDAGEDAQQSEDAADAPEKEERRRPARSVQQRINEAVAKQRRAERETEDLRRRVAALEAAEEKSLPKGEEPAKEKSDGKGPDPEKYTYGELDPRYIADLAEYHADRKAAQIKAEFERERQADAERRTKAEVQQKVEDLVRQGARKYRDFNNVVVKAAEAGDFPVSAEMAELVLGSKVGADVAYHLATHLDLAVRISEMAPLKQAAEFGKLESRYLNASRPRTTTTQAPPPPVSPPRGAGGKFETRPDTADFAAFEARAMKEL